MGQQFDNGLISSNQELLPSISPGQIRAHYVKKLSANYFYPRHSTFLKKRGHRFSSGLMIRGFKSHHRRTREQLKQNTQNKLLIRCLWAKGLLSAWPRLGKNSLFRRNSKALGKLFLDILFTIKWWCPTSWKFLFEVGYSVILVL